MKSNTIYIHIVRFSSLDRRLRLNQLPQSLRNYATRVVGIALVACLIIVLSGLGLYPFEATIELPESLSPIRANLSVPFSLMPILLLGLGLLAGALFFASYQPGWVMPFPTRLILGLFGAVLPLSFVDYSLNATTIRNSSGLIQILLYLQFAFVLIAFGCGLATIICTFISSHHIVRWATRFAAGPYVWMALAFLTFRLWWDFLARAGQLNAETMFVIYYPVTALIAYVTPLVWIAGVISFWQALTEVKLFSRDIGLRIADLSDRSAWLLAALFAIKGAWLLAGYWRVVNGGAGEPWAGSSRDGPLAWLLAVSFAITVGLWLSRWRKPVDTSQFGKGALFLTGGFLLPFISAYFIYVPAMLLLGTGLGDAGSLLASLAFLLADNGYLWSLLFTASLLPLGIVFLRLERFRDLASLCLLTGLWSLPSVIQGLLPDLNSSFEYLTYDAALTLVLFTLATLLWRGKQHKANAWIITLVLVVSTLVALAESVIPSELGYLSFTFLLTVPMLYQLFFDSTELNVAGITQGQRVIRTVGLQAGLMLVLAWAVVLGLLSPAQAGFEDVADKIFLPPLLALFLAATISDKK